jgi:hypothetical protein
MALRSQSLPHLFRKSSLPTKTETFNRNFRPPQHRTELFRRRFGEAPKD